MADSNTTLSTDLMPYARPLGMKIVSAEKDGITAELQVTEALCTTGKIMHGGAIMTVADTLGAMAAFLNLPEGAAGTTTIESKTNFMRAAPVGSTVHAETSPLHVGRRTSVWQTTLRLDNGKTVAVVTQSQMVL